MFWVKLSSGIYGLIRRFSDKEAIKILADAGFDGFDLTISYGSEAEKSLENDYMKYAEEIKQYANSLGIECVQAHAPQPSREDGEYYDKIVRAIELAAYVGAKIIVVHPIKDEGDGFQWQKQSLFEKNMRFYKSLIPYAEKYNIKIAIENIYSFDKRRNVVVSSVCSHGDEFSEYIDVLNSEYIVACVDTGHAALVSDSAQNLLKILGKRVQALHVHDVDCVGDNHTLPYTRLLDWDDICKTLAEVGYEGCFNYEAGNFYSRYMEDDFIPVAAKFAEQVGRSLIRKIERFRH
ncbi:MAG: sugar phosphate isomerase/epimerase [Ruminococcaceae bacterium]|nr:sugar phosphate isomerase/epimerase [Oscillospiraceae bacterium]